MTPALLPCPFCGAPAEFEYNEELDDGGGQVKCTGRVCGALGPYGDRDYATAAWNRRAG